MDFIEPLIHTDFEQDPATLIYSTPIDPNIQLSPSDLDDIQKPAWQSLDLDLPLNTDETTQIDTSGPYLDGWSYPAPLANPIPAIEKMELPTSTLKPWDLHLSINKDHSTSQLNTIDIDKIRPSSSSFISNSTSTIESPILKSQAFSIFNDNLRNLSFGYTYNYNDTNNDDNDNNIISTTISTVATINDISPPTSIDDTDDFEDHEILNNLTPNTKTGKKISDSRLSLAQLSVVLNLKGNDEETAKREKNILNILKNDLHFPIGEKTWIRDTPINERHRILNELTDLVENRFHYGYSKKILSIIVRRASYYMMQGRLRRQRRLQRKLKKT